MTISKKQLADACDMARAAGHAVGYAEGKRAAINEFDLQVQRQRSFIELTKVVTAAMSQNGQLLEALSRTFDNSGVVK